jgi:hypothetical protein
MPQAYFRNARVKFYDVRHTETGPVCRIHCACDYTDHLIEEMNNLDWRELPLSMRSAKLVGELAGCEKMIVTPTGQLSANEAQIPIMRVGDFAVVRVKEDEDYSNDELRFVVRTNHASAPIALWEYLQTCGESPALIKVSYATQSSISETDEPEAAADDRQQELIPVGKPKRKTKAEQMEEAVAEVVQ